MPVWQCSKLGYCDAGLRLKLPPPQAEIMMAAVPV
jgi:hypothetical protein